VQLLALLFLSLGKRYVPIQNLGGSVEVKLRWRKSFLFFSALPLFLLLALRYQVGSDYGSYSNAYMAIASYSFFESVPPGYTAWLGSGFVYFCKLIALFFGEDFLWYHAVLAAFSLLFLYMAIFENSKMPLFSLFIYLCEGYYYQLFNASRQGLAILIVFFSYKYILENRLMPFILTVLAASLIHSSVLIFLPAFLLAKKKFNIKTVLIFAAAGFILVINWNVVEWIVSMTRYVRYINSDFNITGKDVTILWIIYRAGIFGFCLLFRKIIVQKYPNVDCLYVLCASSLVLQMMSVQSYIFARTVIYYYIGMLLLIPYVVKLSEKKDRIIIVPVLIIIFASAHIYYFVAKADVMLAPAYRTFLR
jgi:hypothetical protein